MDKLAAYKLDSAFTDGVEITLDGAPDVIFRVRLPSQYNRPYTQRLYAGMGMSIGPDGQVKADGSLLDTRYAQEAAFVEHCLMSMDGEPIPPQFAQDYPQAVTELLNKATDLASALEEKVGSTAKKSPTSSNGNAPGQDGKSSTATLKKAAG